MRKTVTLLTLLLCFGFSGNSQVNSHALGLRFGGDGTLNGAEVSYQHQVVSNINRVEFDLGFASSRVHNRMFLCGIYHWVWHLTGGLRSFAGPGASFAFFSGKNSEDFVNLGLGGQLGFEYNFNRFDIPFIVSLDTRPMWTFLGDHADMGWETALGVRFTW